MMQPMRRFLRNKRGITPVLSSLLLTVIAVAAMSLATTATYVITTNLRETMSERAVIEDVWFNNSTGIIQVYLRNTGKVAIHVSGVYINHTASYFARPFDLEVYQHRWLNVSQNWSAGDVCSIDVVTTRGTHVGGYYKAP